MQKKINASKNMIQLPLMILISVITQFLLIMKSSYTAAQFGASEQMDAYNFANNVTSFLFSFIGSGVTTVIIPAYVNKKKKEDVDTFITIIYAVVFSITGLLFLLRRPLVEIMTSRGTAFENTVCEVMLATIIIQSVTAILAITTAYYQCENKYNIPKLIVLMCNMLVVTSLYVFGELSIYQYLMVLVSGALLNLILDLGIAVKQGFRYKPTFEFGSVGVKEMILLFIPCMFSTGVYKVHSFVDTLIASNLGEGQLTVLSYANMIVGLVNTLIISNLTVYAYPKIVAKVSGNVEESQKAIWKYSTFFHATVCMLITLYMCVGKECISVLFLHGKFDAQSAMLTYICCGIYIFGQQNNIVRDLVYRYFFARGDTKTTFKNSVFISVCNIVLSLVMVVFIGIYGIIIGTFISGAISLVLIIFKLNKKERLAGSFKPFCIEFLKNNVVMFGTTIAVVLLKTKFYFNYDIINIMVYGIITAVLFIVVLFLARSKVLNRSYLS